MKNGCQLEKGIESCYLEPTQLQYNRNRHLHNSNRNSRVRNVLQKITTCMICNRDFHLYYYNKNCHPLIRCRKCHLNMYCRNFKLHNCNRNSHLLARERSTNITVTESTTSIITIEPLNMHNCSRLCHQRNCYRKCQLHIPVETATCRINYINFHLQKWCQSAILLVLLKKLSERVSTKQNSITYIT